MIHCSDISAGPTGDLAAIVLAAGKGTRMNNEHADLPKVAHVAAGKPMVRWVVESCRAAGAAPIVLVIGHRGDVVRDIFRGDDSDIRYAVQQEQRGTGHAVRQAEPALQAVAPRDVLVVYGDGPLIRGET